MGGLGLESHIAASWSSKRELSALVCHEPQLVAERTKSTAGPHEVLALRELSSLGLNARVCMRAKVALRLEAVVIGHLEPVD